MPPATFAAVVELNLQSAFVTTQAVARRLVDRGEPAAASCWSSSISGTSAMPFGAPYAAAKAGVLALVRTAALELGPHGVRVNAVVPGTVRTAHSERGTPTVDSPEEQTGDPAAVGGARPTTSPARALYLLSDLAGFVTGHALVVDGGSSVRPSFLDADDLPVFVRDAPCGRACYNRATHVPDPGEDPCRPSSIKPSRGGRSRSASPSRPTRCCGATSRRSSPT